MGVDNGNKRGHLDYGIKKLDECTSGMRTGEFVVLASRPAAGKTTFALNIAVDVARRLQEVFGDSKPPYVCYFSLELSGVMLYRPIAQGIGSENKEDVPDSYIRMKNYSIYLNKSPELTPEDIRTQTRKLQEKQGLTLVIIDYLQMLSFGGKPVSEWLKTLAADLSVPVMALSQIQGGRKRLGKTPRLADLREFEGLEKAADTVLFLNRHEDDSTELIIAKSRTGNKKVINIKFGDTVISFLKGSVWQ